MWVRFTGVVFSCLLLVLPMVLQAQEQPPQTVLKPFTIGVSVAPGLSYRSLVNNTDGSSTIDRFIDNRNDDEELRFSYFASIDFGYNFNRWLSLHTGVEYGNLGYQTVRDELTYGDMIDPRYGYVYNTGSGSVPSHIRFIYNFHYVSIPVMLRFTAGKERLKLLFAVGVLADFLVEASTTRVLFYGDRLNDYQTASDTYNDYNTLNISPKVQLGLIYALNPNMNVALVPEFRYGLLKIIDTPITGYLYGGGIRLQYEYRF